MTIAELHAYFDLLTDKTGSAYFTDAEKDSFITNASIEYVKQMLPSSEGGVVNLEFDQIVFSNLDTLVFETAGLTPTGTGKITRSSVQSALNTASGSTEPLMYILNASWTKSGVTYPVKYVRQNEWYEFELNSFKKGKSTRPTYKQDSLSFTFAPIDTGASVKFTLLKQPKTVSLSGGITTDLPISTHKAVVEIAVNLASTAIRDGELAQLNNKQ